MRLIHISDPHLSTLDDVSWTQLTGKRLLGYLSWRRRRRYAHTHERLAALCAAVQQKRADLICVTGDLTHIGLPNEIHQAGQWLARLGPPDGVFVIPGNHDVYAADSWATVIDQWRPYLHLETSPADPKAGYPTQLTIAGTHVVGLNSGNPTAPALATGSVGTSQIERFATMLADAPPDTLPIVAIHHPVTPGAASWRKSLTDAAALRPVLARAPIVLHGHQHQNQEAQLDGARVYQTGSASTASASFRCFDIERNGDGWEIEMALHSLRGANFPQVAADRFTVSA